MGYNRYDNKRSYSRSSKGGEIKSNSEDDASIPHQPIQAKYLEVKVFENFDRALRAFRALVQKERVLSTYKDRQSYEKPSDKRRRKKNEMRRKSLELEFKNDEPSEPRKRRKFKQTDEN
jgi:ribosomal protein S21